MRKRTRQELSSGHKSILVDGGLNDSWHTQSSFTIKLFMMVVYALGITFAFISLHEWKSAKTIEEVTVQSEFESLYANDLSKLSRVELIALSEASTMANPPMIALSRASTEVLLKGARPCLDCELRLVYLSVLETGRLSDSAFEALRNSYKLSPYGDTDVMKWRLNLSSHYWSDLPDDLKQSALTQVTGLSSGALNLNWLRSFETSVPELKRRIEVL